jgi:spore maturation protein CgeB
MIQAGYSPSVRLFEAAACGTPIVSDIWDGIDTLFAPDREIVLARTPEDVLELLVETGDERRASLAAGARQRVLGEHTAGHRARTLERDLREALEASRPTVSGPAVRRRA